MKEQVKTDIRSLNDEFYLITTRNKTRTMKSIKLVEENKIHFVISIFYCFSRNSCYSMSKP